MSQTPENVPAGWYPHPGMANTLRYWDGSSWSDQVAPAGAAASPARSGPGVATIVAGIVIAVLVLVAGVWFFASIVTADDDLDCATQNAQRAQDGRPQLDCD